MITSVLKPDEELDELLAAEEATALDEEARVLELLLVTILELEEVGTLELLTTELLLDDSGALELEAGAAAVVTLKSTRM